MKWGLALLAISTAAAHDLQVSIERSNLVVIARAAYAGTDPCAYASVLIYAPGNDRREHQNGRTDADGVFAFLPNRTGVWRLVVDDEMGHRKEVTIDVSAAARASHETGQQPVWQKAIIGAALILGLTGFFYGWKARRAS